MKIKITNGVEKLNQIYGYLYFKGRVRSQKELAGKINHTEESMSAAFGGNERYLTKKLFQKIDTVFPDVFNIDYLLDDTGNILKEAHEVVPFAVSTFKQRGYSPFYSELQVSAGQYDLATIEQTEEAESWIKIPGVTAEAWFPVVGCSMEPKIYAGDMVGVVSLNRWDRLDPDKIYMIITHEDRMIKRLEIDESNPDVLWAVSTNLARFKIYVEDIKKIFHVVWAGRLV